MKEEITKQEKTVCKARLSALNVGMFYSFMVKRISKGYSTSEVSFLMGFSIDYIKQKEELKTIGFSFEDLHSFKRAIEESSLRGFIHNYEVQNYDSDYHLTKATHKASIITSLYRIESDHTETLVFRLMEENQEFIRYKASEEETAAEVKTILKVLFDGRLFYTPQSPLNIYQRCRTAFGNESLSPRHVQAALAEMTKQKEFPKLKRIKSKDYGCQYEKVFE